MPDMALINELSAIKARLDALEEHRDGRLTELERVNDQLRQRIEALEPFLGLLRQAHDNMAMTSDTSFAAKRKK